MRKSMFKSVSLVLSAGVLLTSCSVGSTQNVANYSGGVVPTGVFVLYELNNAKNHVIEEMTQTDPELIKRNDNGTLDDLAIYGTSFNGQLVEDLIVNRAKKEVAMAVGADAVCKDLGLKQTEQEKQQIEQLKNSYDYNEEYFNEIGVSLSSWQKYAESEQKRAALFNHYYGEKGTESPKEEELKKEFKDSYVNILTRMFSYGSDEDKKEKKEKAQEFLAAAKKDGFLEAWQKEEAKQNEERAESLKERREKLEENKKKREEEEAKKKAQEQKAGTKEESKASAQEGDAEEAGEKEGGSGEESKAEPNDSKEDKTDESGEDDEEDEDEDVMDSPERFEEKRLKEEEEELQKKQKETKEETMERLKKENTILNKKVNLRTALSPKEINKIDGASAGDVFIVESTTGKAFWVVEKLELGQEEFEAQKEQVLHDVCDKKLEAKLLAAGQGLKVTFNEGTIKAFSPSKLYKKEDQDQTANQNNW